MSEMTPIPALVDHKAVCRILEISSGNLGKVANLPAPLQERGIRGLDVSARLWLRSEIEALAKSRAERKKAGGNGN